MDVIIACETTPRSEVREKEGNAGPLVDMGYDEPIAGRPGALAGPMVWSGADFKSDEPYAWRLAAEEVVEIEVALEGFKSLGLNGDEVSQNNFPLPRLSTKLALVAETLHRGRGFVTIKGLDASRYSVEDSVTIYLGLASHVADKRGLQDSKGNVLSHITNSKLWDVPMEQRHGIHSSQALPFHNDMGCDILALQVRHGAQSGGHTFLSSAWTIFNKLVRDEPVVAKTLLTPNWPVQISGRKSHHYLAPVFAIHEGLLMASMDPNRLGPHPASADADVPALTAAQRHAIERTSAVAADTELQLELEAGDLLFLNNWAMLHRRDAYQDGQHTSRHLVRLWLRSTKLGWSIPTEMLPPWLAAYGETSRARERIYSLYPMATYVVPKYSTGSAAFTIDDTDESDGESCDLSR